MLVEQFIMKNKIKKRLHPIRQIIKIFRPMGLSFHTWGCLFSIIFSVQK